MTYADTSALERAFGFKPGTSMRKACKGLLSGTGEFYIGGKKEQG